MPGFELIGQEEFNQVKQVFEESRVLFRHSFDNLRNGIFKVRDFEEAFACRMQVPHALAVTSGTAALRVALAALDIKPGDEVITQSFTFVATVEAIIESGATPIITEIDDTLNMDPADLDVKITEKTRAIIAVHMLGVPARLREITNVAQRHDIPLVEDTAWGCGGTFRNKFLGTHGTIGTFSFDFAKTMTTGEGGMLVFHDEKLAAKAKAWHDHGHENNPKLPRWEDSRASSGFNFRMMELQGAIGLAQLTKLDQVIAAQRLNKKKIKTAIENLAVRFRTVPDGSEETADALVFFVDDNNIALRCRDALIDSGLGTKILPEAVTWHFAGTWDHMPSLVNAHGGNLGNAFPNSKTLLGRSVALPINVRMKDDVPQRIRIALKSVIG